MDELEHLFVYSSVSDHPKSYQYCEGMYIIYTSMVWYGRVGYGIPYPSLPHLEWPAGQGLHGLDHLLGPLGQPQIPGCTVHCSRCRLRCR